MNIFANLFFITNSIIQFLTITWVFVNEGIWLDPPSVSSEIQTLSVFLLVLTVTIYIQDLSIFLYTCSQNFLFNYISIVFPLIILHQVGWTMVCSFDTENRVLYHYIGAFLFVVSFVILSPLFIMYSQSITLATSYILTAIAAFLYAFFYFTGEKVVAFLLEWLAFWLYSISHILFAVSMSWEII